MCITTQGEYPGICTWNFELLHCYRWITPGTGGQVIKRPAAKKWTVSEIILLGAFTYIGPDKIGLLIDPERGSETNPVTQFSIFQYFQFV